MSRRSNPRFEVVDSEESLAELVERLLDEPAYAVDTEFHRERTYFPKVSLIQMADRRGVALVDALKVDPAPLARVLEGEGLAVMHAARQDLEVLDRACGAVPTRLVDTQIEAGFLGYTSPSLATLLDRELAIRIPKADRLTDWLKRPLGATQLSYAAADVSDLLRLHEILADKIVQLGRTHWVEDACEELRTERRGPRDPEDAWIRIKEIRHLRGHRLAVAQAVASWREKKAMETDQTPRFILSDLGVVGIASAMPTTVDQLRSLRGVEGRNLKSNLASEVLEIIEGAKDTRPQRAPASQLPELPSELRPAVPLISAWMTQRARELQLETALLATRSDLEALLRGIPDARLSTGWRAEVVGEPIRMLLSGEAALGFDRGSGLVLIPQDICGGRGAGDPVDPPASEKG